MAWYRTGGGGTDTSDATLNSGNQMLKNVTAYADDVKYTGTIETKTASDLTTSGNTVYVPKGYYDSAVSKAVASGSATTPATTKQQSQPSISIDSNGLITSSVAETSVDVTPTVSAGYVDIGTAGTITMSANSNTSQLSTQAATTYNTSTTDQTITANKYITGAQTIKAVTTSGITASNIIKDAVITVGDSNNATRIANVTGTADYTKTVTSVPTTKDTSIIYNSTDGKYYLWED